MHLEAIVIDAHHPDDLAEFWAAALELDVREATPEGTSLQLGIRPDLRLVFVPVSAREPRPHRLHLDLNGGDQPEHLVQQMLALGARHTDIGQGEAPWTVLVDPEDYAFCVMPGTRYPRDTGPVGSLPLDSDDPAASARFWQAATGWDLVEPLALQHPSRRGPELAICDPVEPKRGKNPLHLDVRVDHGEDLQEQVRRLLDLGATRLDHDWGPLPWTVLLEPGGNELCVLPPE